MPLEQLELNMPEQSFDYKYPERKPTSRRKPNALSKEAHDSIKPAKSFYYEKIIEGLKKLKVGGHFEEVAIASGIKPDQAWKRLSELVDSGICFNTGITRTTSSGRRAMVRQLTELK